MSDPDAAATERELQDAYWDPGPLVRLERHVLLAGHLADDVRAAGLRLSALLGLPFADTVRLSEHESGMSFARLASRHGEAERREVEARSLRAALTGRPFGIVAVGPDTLVARSGRDLVRRRAHLVALDLDFESYCRRLAVLAGRRQQAEDEVRAERTAAEGAAAGEIIAFDAPSEPATPVLETLHRAFRRRVQALDQASFRFEVRGLSPDAVARRLMQYLPALRSA